jgi:hypothetical protein
MYDEARAWRAYNDELKWERFPPSLRDLDALLRE